MLLILAAVSIATLTGKNGILTQTQNAKLETRAGNVEETVQLWKNEKISSKYTNGTVKTEEELLENMKTDKILFEEEIDRENKIITIGGRRISYKIEEEIVEQDELELLINSGETGKVDLTGLFTNGVITIYWGDGRQQEYNDIGNESTMISVEEKIHTYSQTNQEYNVKVKGKLYFLELDENDSIIEILNWGKTGMKSITMSDCKNLEKIAKPNSKSFENLENCNSAFSGCLKLKDLPNGLFANADKVKDFTFAFKGCIGLTYIPEDTFKGCSSVETFGTTFWGCINLENYLPLWDQNYYLYGNENMSETTGGDGCYLNCSKLKENGLYNDIPKYWSEGTGPG